MYTGALDGSACVVVLEGGVAEQSFGGVPPWVCARRAVHSPVLVRVEGHDGEVREGALAFARDEARRRAVRSCRVHRGVGRPRQSLRGARRRIVRAPASAEACSPAPPRRLVTSPGVRRSVCARVRRGRARVREQQQRRGLSRDLRRAPAPRRLCLRGLRLGERSGGHGDARRRGVEAQRRPQLCGGRERLASRRPSARAALRRPRGGGLGLISCDAVELLRGRSAKARASAARHALASRPRAGIGIAVARAPSEDEDHSRPSA